MESEAMSLAGCVANTVHLERLHFFLGGAPGVVTVQNDNLGCIQAIENPINSKRLKHVDIKFMYVKELVMSGTIQLEYVPTDFMAADIFTKALVADKITRLVALGVMKLKRAEKKSRKKGLR